MTVLHVAKRAVVLSKYMRPPMFGHGAQGLSLTGYICCKVVDPQARFRIAAQLLLTEPRLRKRALYGPIPAPYKQVAPETKLMFPLAIKAIAPHFWGARSVVHTLVVIGYFTMHMSRLIKRF